MIVILVQVVAVVGIAVAIVSVVCVVVSVVGAGSCDGAEAAHCIPVSVLRLAMLPPYIDKVFVLLRRVVQPTADCQQKELVCGGEGAAGGGTQRSRGFCCDTGHVFRTRTGTTAQVLVKILLGQVGGSD